MKKYLLTGLLLAFSTQLMASSSNRIENKVQLQFTDYSDIEESHGLRSLSNSFLDVKVENIQFPKGTQYKKLLKAIDILDDILNSAEFRKKVISYKRPNGKNEYSKSYLWQEVDNVLSTRDVYSLIMQADEKMVPGTQGEMNLNIKKYHKWWSRVIGYTNPSRSNQINVNWKFYKNYEVHQMVGNLVHEWLHLLGFLHGKEAPHEEVPYVVGRIASEIAKKKMTQK